MGGLTNQHNVSATILLVPVGKRERERKKQTKSLVRFRFLDSFCTIFTNSNQHLRTLKWNHFRTHNKLFVSNKMKRKKSAAFFGCEGKRLICKNKALFTPHGTGFYSLQIKCVVHHKREKMYEKNCSLTHMNFMATNLNPLASKRLMISPTIPRWTPSGLIMRKVRSWLPAIAFAIYERNANKVQIIDDHTNWNDSELICDLTRKLLLAVVSIDSLFYRLFCTVYTCAGVWVKSFVM